MNDSENGQLLKLLGIGFGIAVTVGGTIGAGILRKPGMIAAQVPSPSWILILWALIGLYALLGVLCAIELGVAIPEAGAWYVYARRAFGSYIGFVTGITSWAGTTTALGFGAYTTAEYVQLLVPGSAPYTPIIAISLLILLALFHSHGTALGGWSQSVMSVLKAIGFLIFVICCFALGQQINPHQILEWQNQNSQPILLTGVISALQAIFYTYDGWHTAAYFSEENTNARNNLPRAMIIGVLAVIGIYLLFNAALLYALPMAQLQQSTLPAAAVITALFGPQTANVITLFLIISILGLINAQMMFAPRVIFSMGRDGLFWQKVRQVNPHGTPIVGLYLTAGTSIGLILMGKSLSVFLSDIATFFFVLSYSAGFASLIRLRQIEPNLPRPFKTPGYPWVPLGLLIISILFLIGTVWQDLQSSRFALYFLVCSYPLYRWIKAGWAKQPEPHHS